MKVRLLGEYPFNTPVANDDTAVAGQPIVLATISWDDNPNINPFGLEYSDGISRAGADQQSSYVSTQPTMCSAGRRCTPPQRTGHPHLVDYTDLATAADRFDFTFDPDNSNNAHVATSYLHFGTAQTLLGANSYTCDFPSVTKALPSPHCSKPPVSLWLGAALTKAIRTCVPIS